MSRVFTSKTAVRLALFLNEILFLENVQLFFFLIRKFKNFQGRKVKLPSSKTNIPAAVSGRVMDHTVDDLRRHRRCRCC